MDTRQFTGRTVGNLGAVQRPMPGWQLQISEHSSLSTTIQLAHAILHSSRKQQPTKEDTRWYHPLQVYYKYTIQDSSLACLSASLEGGKERAESGSFYSVWDRSFCRCSCFHRSIDLLKEYLSLDPRQPCYYTSTRPFIIIGIWQTSPFPCPVQYSPVQYSLLARSYEKKPISSK